MYTYEPYLAHKGGRIKGSKNGYHIFGEQQSAGHYKLGDLTIGFVKNAYNAGKSVGEAWKGFKDWREYQKYMRIAAKKNPGDKDFDWWDYVGKFNHELDKKKYNDLLNKAIEAKKRYESHINLSRAYSKVGGILIDTARYIYGRFTALKNFIKGIGNKKRMYDEDIARKANGFQEIINPSTPASKMQADSQKAWNGREAQRSISNRQKVTPASSGKATQASGYKTTQARYAQNTAITNARNAQNTATTNRITRPTQSTRTTFAKTNSRPTPADVNKSSSVRNRNKG